MNRLTTQDRVRMLTALSEGMGINAACRMTGASKNTVLKLLADVGMACALYQDQTMHGLKITQVQADEIWSFIGMKAKNVPADADPELRLGDCYTFTAIDPVTKLMPSWLVGFRTAQCADEFMGDLAARASPIEYSSPPTACTATRTPLPSTSAWTWTMRCRTRATLSARP